MKRALFSACLSLLALPLAAAPLALVGVSATVKVSGDSTLHQWQAVAASVTLGAELKDAKGGLEKAVKAGALRGLELVVSVASLKSNEGSSMDKNMAKAMDADEFPEIRFSLSSYQLEGATVTAKGSLSIHGVSKDVELKGLLGLRDGALTVSGSYPLLMSDFGVKPPVMMLGAVRVKDAVVITYDYALTRQ